MRLGPGAKVSHYEIRSLLGVGGMGEVYLARDTRLLRPVAIKVMRAGGGDAAFARALDTQRV